MPQIMCDTLLIFQRQLRLSLRSPAWIAIGLIQPALYLVFFAPLLMSIAHTPGFPPGTAWQVETSPGRFTVQGGPGQTITDVTAPDLTVSGTPTDLLRWAWNRETPGAVSPLRVDGDIEGLVEFRACVVEATQ